MRDKIENILSQMAKGECEPEETIDSLLVLLGVSQQRELLLGFLETEEAALINSGKIELHEGIESYAAQL